MAVYLADKSALIRSDSRPDVPEVVGAVAARRADRDLRHRRRRAALQRLGPRDVRRARRGTSGDAARAGDGALVDRAIEVQAALAAESEHRSVPLPDLLVAACAESAGLTVLHYDAD